MKKNVLFRKVNFFVLHNKFVIIFFCLALILSFINSFHEQYPDEFDNLLGGWYILRGILPFSGFFSHHGPVAYFVSAFVQLFSGHSFVSFRVVYNTFLVIGIFASYFYLTKRFGAIATRFYLYFAILLGITATYFWGQMLLADTLAAYFLTPVFAFFILKYTYKMRINIGDVWFISILTMLALLTSLTYIYLCFFVYLFLCIAYLTEYRSELRSRKSLKFLTALVLPYIILLIYLLVTRSIGDYVYQSIIFNEKYYIYNYPGLQNGHINPIRFLIVIFNTFYNNFFPLLEQVRDFNFIYPFNITLATVDTAFLIYCLLRRSYSQFFFILLYMIYANARSNPLSSKETDYQSAVYIMMSLVNICFLLPMLFKELHLQIGQGRKAIVTVLFLVCAVYSFFTVGMLINKFVQKAYGKYMGLAPLIYDRSDAAPFVNAVTTDNDYIWLGPLDFQDYYYSNGMLASKYHILIPGMKNSEKIRQEFIADMNIHKPKIIIYNQHFTVLGSDPVDYAPYFTQYLTNNYLSLSKLGYVSTVASNSTFDFTTDIYINKDDLSTVLGQLQAKNLIKHSL